MLTKEQNSNFIERVLEIEQELKKYPEMRKELDMELINITCEYNKAHKSKNIYHKKDYKCLRVKDMSDMIQVRFSLVDREK